MFAYTNVGCRQTCMALTMCPCEVDTNAATTDRSAESCPSSRTSRSESRALREGSDSLRVVGRRGSRDRKANGMKTTSWAIRVTCMPRCASTSKNSDSSGVSPMSPTQGVTYLRVKGQYQKRYFKRFSLTLRLLSPTVFPSRHLFHKVSGDHLG